MPVRIATSKQQQLFEESPTVINPNPISKGAQICQRTQIAHFLLNPTEYFVRSIRSPQIGLAERPDGRRVLCRKRIYDNK